MANKSHLTAIARRGASAPCLWLERNDRISGRTLDWGCGRGADVKHLQCEGYDPHYQPVLPDGVFDTILMTYVLNTIPGYFCRAGIVQDAFAYLKEGGSLYIAIRADMDSLNGWTDKGTWQGYVGEQLERGGFDLVHRIKNQFEIWGLLPPPD